MSFSRACGAASRASSASRNPATYSHPAARGAATLERDANRPVEAFTAVTVNPGATRTRLWLMRDPMLLAKNFSSRTTAKCAEQ